jgi:hypothetical protein
MVASFMAAGLNSQSEAARVMSEKTIVTSPSGARTPPPAVPSCAASHLAEWSRDRSLPLDEFDADEPDGSVHDPSPAALAMDGPDDDDEYLEVKELLLLESPTMELRRVMISRKVGRMVGSGCQQLTSSSRYSGDRSSS